MVARRRPALITPEQARALGFTVSEITKALRAVGEDRRPFSGHSIRRLSDENAPAPLWLRRLRDERGMKEAAASAEHARRTAPKVRLFSVDLGVVEDKIFSGEEFTRDERFSYERIVEDALDKVMDSEPLSNVEHAALARARAEGDTIWLAA